MDCRYYTLFRECVNLLSTGDPPSDWYGQRRQVLLQAAVLVTSQWCNE